MTRSDRSRTRRPRLEVLEARLVPTFPAVIALDNLGTLGATVSGFANGAQSGLSVSDAGDVNGDGIGDFVVGAPLLGGIGTTRGEAYVVFGRADLSTIDLNDLGTGGFTVLPFQNNQRVGTSVSAAGDVNGDGFDDVVIGANFTAAPGQGDGDGEAYVIFGAADLGGAALTVNALGTRGFTIRGVESELGRSVGAAGDFNGDGFDDVVVAAPLDDVAGFAAGKVLVVFGGTDLAGTTLVSDALGNRGFTLIGSEEVGGLGNSVSGAGDVNGDGRADVVVGAPPANGGGENRGEAYVVFGADDLAGVTLAANAIGTRGFTLRGFENNANAGASVSGAGDVDGDGKADVVVGAPFTDVGGSARGEAYVVFGADNLADTVITLNALGTRGFTLRGVVDVDFLGSSVSGAGDVNGDGKADVLVGASAADAGALNAGEAYVVFGADDLAGAAIASNDLGTRGFALRGFETFARVGTSVSAAGDVNGDGIADLIVGAPETNVGGNERGESYVIFGQIDAPPTALANATDVTDASNATVYEFTVTYTDDAAVVGNTLDGNDVRVTGPNAFDAAATFVSATPTGNAAQVVATYRIAPPGGTWDAADNGTYQVNVQANQVRDSGNNAVAGGVVGQFDVTRAQVDDGGGDNGGGDDGGDEDVTGLVFRDLNLDGRFSLGDSVLAGRTVFLDAGELSASSGLDGRFTLAGVGDLRAVLFAFEDATLIGNDIAIRTGVPEAVLPPAPDVALGAGAAALVQAAYLDLLGRDPSAEEIAALAPRLGQLTPQQLVDHFLLSREYLTNQVREYYRDLLGREGSDEEVAGWVDARLSGLSARDAIVEFLTSAEFASQHQGSGDFANAAYRLLLGRDAEASALADLTMRLDAGLSRAEVVRGILSSQELAERSVASLFAGLLRREPDAAGLEALAALSQATSLDEVIRAVLASQEYQGVVAGRIG